MIDFQHSPNVFLTAEAIPATIASLLAYALAKVFGNVNSIHGCNGGRNPRLTASTSASVLRRQPL